MTYNILMSTLGVKANEAYDKDDYDLGSRYSQAMKNLSSLANVSYKLKIRFIGDPTSSNVMASYEYLWKVMINFAYQHVDLFLKEYSNYLSDTYKITIDLNSTNLSTDVSSMFSIDFEVIGGKARSVKETFIQMYFSVLVFEQLVQSFMLGSITIIILVGYDTANKIFTRLKRREVINISYTCCN
ncbi:MAG: hypothetical protein ACP6IS_10330 [Candidatus Asgardarchaeia archaeon]